MYIKGDLKIGKMRDTSMFNYPEMVAAYLPHPFTDLVIGGMKEIQALIDDLVVAKKEFEKGR